LDALDGNAIAGMLVAAFGTEMTTATGICASCGASSHLAELAVYLKAPGAVARCGSCGSVVMVLVEINGITRADTRGLAALEPTA
jgi:hypothetical protein